MTKTFAQWMGQVNKLLIQKCGMNADCIPDYDYYSAYQFGDTPEETAEDAIEEARSY